MDINIVWDFIKSNAYEIGVVIAIIVGAYLKTRKDSEDKKDLVSAIEDPLGNVTTRTMNGIIKHMKDAGEIPDARTIVEMAKKSVKDEVASKGNTRIDNLVEKLYGKEK